MADGTWDIDAREVLKAVQIGPNTPVIGYDAEQNRLFAHGWNAAMNRVYSVLSLSRLECAEQYEDFDCRR